VKKAKEANIQQRIEIVIARSVCDEVIQIGAADWIASLRSQ